MKYYVQYTLWPIYWLGWAITRGCFIVIFAFAKDFGELSIWFKQRHDYARKGIR